MVRVLHVLGGLGLGGAESRIMDLYRHTDREKVQFDFLVHMDENKYRSALKEGSDPANLRTPQYYDDEVRTMGGHIYVLPSFKVYNTGLYKRAVGNFFSEHHDYNVIQGHMTSTASIYLPIAARYRTGGPNAPAMVTVAHTRNAGVDRGPKGMAVRFLRRSLPSVADYLFACSHLAGDETFGGASYAYIPNTVDTGRFLFDENARDAVRSGYDIPQDAVVIGNVARFSPQKNQDFLIKAFAGMTATNSRLILCGEGALRQDCERLADELGVSGRVIFAGNRSDVERYYSAMDIFALPSSYEGLPGVAVEAQASGCICVISDKVTDDALLTDIAGKCSISEGTGLWSRRFDDLSAAVSDRRIKQGISDLPADRKAYAQKVADMGFDVREQARRMTEFYLNPCRETIPGEYE